ncbi:hypothetical protein ACNQKP_11150 [Bdellovibrio bacteriovorus]|uniref:hypothetical protein n=1 Tax=Bdellovibrio bacteriovorus TaxID=959 RepID=UPI003AA896FB
MRPHRRQFIIGPVEFKNDSFFKTRRLSCGSFISYDSDLPIYTSDDDRYLLIGNAYCSKTGMGAKELVRSVRDVDVDTRTWTGRWILYFQGELYSDLTTSLSMFYRTNCRRFWVSSSVALLAKVEEGLVRPEMVFKESNYLAPTTCVSDVKQVMIGEKVNPSSGAVSWQGFSPLFTTTDDMEVIVGTLVARFETAARAVLNSGVIVYSALTSGQDSRLDLAALLRVSERYAFRTFTFVKSFLFMNPGDRELPKKISKKFGFHHEPIQEGEFRESVGEIYREHCWTLRSTEPGSPFFYLQRGFWQKLPAGVLNLDHCYEIGRNTLYGKGASGVGSDFSREDLIKDGYVIDSEDYLRLDSYFAKLNDEFAIDRRDALYLYKSYPLFGKLFQAQDLWVDSLLLGNSREMFSLLLSVRSELRSGGVFHRRLISAINESLSDFPYNPSQPLWQKLFVRLISRMGNW